MAEQPGQRLRRTFLMARCGMSFLLAVQHKAPEDQQEATEQLPLRQRPSVATWYHPLPFKLAETEVKVEENSDAEKEPTKDKESWSMPTSAGASQCADDEVVTPPEPLEPCVQRAPAKGCFVGVWKTLGKVLGTNSATMSSEEGTGSSSSGCSPRK